MATLQDIRRRIRSVQSTQKITRAMKLVAAAKLRRAQERILEARPYARSMARLVGALARGLGEDKHPLLARRAGPRKLYVVITADKGLCGAFNSNVLRRAQELLRARADGDVTVATLGRKGRDFFRRRRRWPIRLERTGFLDRVTFEQARELAGGLMAAYLADEVDQVWLVYNEFRSVAVQRVVTERLLPIEPPEGAAPGVEYLYEPDPAAILGALLPRHVEVQLYRALLESAAGEQGARMTAMETATKNAEELIERLTIEFNKARQERITKELLDIVGGAEALRRSAEA